jgi:hypothetical protein
MVAFARFTMRDNGLPIYINPEQVSQVRLTSEGEPAVYIAGRDTPMIVEGTVEEIIQMLETVTVGGQAASWAEAPALDAEPSEPETSEAPTLKAKAPAKAKAARKPAKAKTEKLPVEAEAPYATPSWFVGNG